MNFKCTLISTYPHTNMKCLALKIRIRIISPLNPSVTAELNYSEMPSENQSKPKRVVWYGEAVNRVVDPRLPGDALSEPVQPLMIFSPASLTPLTSSLASRHSPDIPHSLTASKALARPLPLVAPSHIPIGVSASASRGVLRQLAVG